MVVREVDPEDDGDAREHAELDRFEHHRIRRGDRRHCRCRRRCRGTHHDDPGLVDLQIKDYPLGVDERPSHRLRQELVRDADKLFKSVRPERLPADPPCLRQSPNRLAAFDRQICLANRLRQSVGAVLVDRLGEHQHHRHFVRQRADDLDVVVLDARLAGVHAVPEQVDVLLGSGLARLGDDPLEVADHTVPRVAELNALGVVQRHRHVGVLEALDDLRDRSACPFLREPLAEDGVDEGALADPGLANDQDVCVTEPLDFPLAIAREELARDRRRPPRSSRAASAPPALSRPRPRTAIHARPTRSATSAAVRSTQSRPSSNACPRRLSSSRSAILTFRQSLWWGRSVDADYR